MSKETFDDLLRKVVFKFYKTFVSKLYQVAPMLKYMTSNRFY